MNYILVFIICTLALIVGILNLVVNELLSRAQKKYFISIAVIIIFEIIIDTISFYIDGKVPNYIIIYRGLKIIEFIVAPCIPAMFAKLIASKSFWSKVRIYFCIVIICNTIAQMITFFRPLMFEIGNNAVYSRTKFGYTYLVFITISVFLLVVSGKKTFIQRTEKTSITLLSVFIFVIIGVVIKLYVPKSNADWLCITFCYFIFILYFNNHYLKIDSTTSLLNRKAFDTKLEKINYPTALIIIDANDFKEVNDKYGHHCGDIAIGKIAEAIFNSYNKFGLCYRIGGDEFCVILKEGVLTEKTNKTENFDTYKMLENLMKDLDNELSGMAKKWVFLKKGVAQGYGIYYSNKQSIEEVFRIADKRMYRNKKV